MSISGMAGRSDRERFLALLADFGIEPVDQRRWLAPEFRDNAPEPQDVILGATDGNDALAQFYFDDAGGFLRLEVRES